MSKGMGMVNISMEERRQEEEKNEQERNAKRKKEIKEREAEARDQQSFHLSKRGYYWAIAGIAASVFLALVQIGISVYDIWVKDHQHETRMIQLDSIQVQQNKEIIKLLEHKK